MKEKVKVYFLLSLLSFSSCEDMSSTTFLGIVNNESGHSIKIIPYKEGKIKESAIVILINGEQYQGTYYSERGILGDSPLNLEFIYDTDSIIVTFDDTIKAFHYTEFNENPYYRFYNRESDRSLYNIKSYEKDIKDLSKKERKVNYVYTFSIDDYLDALSVH